MSHNTGRVLCGTNVDICLGHFRYNGTCDVLASTKVYATPEELSVEWRWPWDPPCAHPGTEVTLTTYDDTLAWHGRYCIECKRITEGFEPTDEAWDAKVGR